MKTFINAFKVVSGGQALGSTFITLWKELLPLTALVLIRIKLIFPIDSLYHPLHLKTLPAILFFSSLLFCFCRFLADPLPVGPGGANFQVFALSFILSSYYKLYLTYLSKSYIFKCCLYVPDSSFNTSGHFLFLKVQTDSFMLVLLHARQSLSSK